MTKPLRAATALLSLLAGAYTYAAEADGPYVIRKGADELEAWSVKVDASEARKQITPLAPGATIIIPSVGEVPEFPVKLRPPAAVAPDTVTTKSGVPLFVVADTHGEYEILVHMLTTHHVVDRALRWSFGSGQLIVLGDVFDRGAHHLEILWLLYSLDEQARKAGGGVQLVLGNHEAMAMRGDLRYLHPKYRQTAEILGISSYSALFSQYTVLGQWLRTRPTVLKLNDYLCLHGGISPELVDRKIALADINATVRSVLNDGVFDTDAGRDRAAFLLGENGPLWYRGYFAEGGAQGNLPVQDIDRIREFFGVKTILVGHTKVPTITPFYQGKVIAVQVYPRHDDSGKDEFQALSVTNKGIYRALPDGKTEPLTIK